jgi:hypothetical protein
MPWDGPGPIGLNLRVDSELLSADLGGLARRFTAYGLWSLFGSQECLGFLVTGRRRVELW